MPTLVRILLTLFGVWAALFGYPWMTIIAMVLLAVRFRAPEVLLLGMGMDFLWLPALSFYYPLPLFTLGALLLFWGLEPLRKELFV